MDDKEDIVSIERLWREGLPKRLISMHMARMGERGGRVKSEKKTKACRLNAQKRWSQPRQVDPGIIAGAAAVPSGGVISSNTPPPSSHVQE